MPQPDLRPFLGETSLTFHPTILGTLPNWRGFGRYKLPRNFPKGLGDTGSLLRVVWAKQREATG